MNVRRVVCPCDGYYVKLCAMLPEHWMTLQKECGRPPQALLFGWRNRCRRTPKAIVFAVPHFHEVQLWGSAAAGCLRANCHDIQLTQSGVVVAGNDGEAAISEPGRCRCFVPGAGALGGGATHSTYQRRPELRLDRPGNDATLLTDNHR